MATHVEEKLRWTWGPNVIPIFFPSLFFFYSPWSTRAGSSSARQWRCSPVTSSRPNAGRCSGSHSGPSSAPPLVAAVQGFFPFMACVLSAPRLRAAPGQTSSWTKPSAANLYPPSSLVDPKGASSRVGERRQ